MNNHPYAKQIEYDRWLLTRFSEHFRLTLGVDHSKQWQIDDFIKNQPRSVVALVVRSDGKLLAVSRRNRPDDLGLPGGKIDPGEVPERAMLRELFEETSLEAKDFSFCYERVDSSDGQVAWCYRVTAWDGLPCQREDGIGVTWVTPERLLDERCTFREYNRELFKELKLL